MIQNFVDTAVHQFQQFLMHIPRHASKWILPPSCLHFLLPVAKCLSKASTHCSGPCNSHASPRGTYDGQTSNMRGSSPCTSVATCHYHSTNAPYSFIHVSPHHIFLPNGIYYTTHLKHSTHFLTATWQCALASLCCKLILIFRNTHALLECSCTQHYSYMNLLLCYD